LQNLTSYFYLFDERNFFLLFSVTSFCQRQIGPLLSLWCFKWFLFSYQIFEYKFSLVWCFQHFWVASKKNVSQHLVFCDLPQNTKLFSSIPSLVYHFFRAQKNCPKYFFCRKNRLKYPSNILQGLFKLRA
jgi:hypothetical protein